MDEHVATAQRRDNQTPPPVEGAAPTWLGIFGRVPLVLGAVCGLAICLIGGLTLTLLHGGAQSALPAPDTAAQQVCADLIRQDYTSLYGMLSSAQQSTGTEAQFEASQRELDIASGNVGQCAVSVATNASGAAQAQYSVTRGVNSAIVGAATLTYVNGNWRLDTYDASVI